MRVGACLESVNNYYGLKRASLQLRPLLDRRIRNVVQCHADYAQRKLNADSTVRPRDSSSFYVSLDVAVSYSTSKNTLHMVNVTL